LKNGKKCIQSNNEKLEPLNSFQKLIFGQRSAGSLKVPPGARGPRPQSPHLAMPLRTYNRTRHWFVQFVLPKQRQWVNQHTTQVN